MIQTLFFFSIILFVSNICMYSSYTLNYRLEVFVFYLINCFLISAYIVHFYTMYRKSKKYNELKINNELENEYKLKMSYILRDIKRAKNGK